MRIFVTGATGVLGRRVVPLLMVAGHAVTAVARTADKAQRLQSQGAVPLRIDLFKADAVHRAVAGHDVVINLATHIPSSSKMFLPGAFATNDRIRREVSRNVVDAALLCGAGRVIQESITLIYPDAGDEWIDESWPIDPPSYARSVADAEAQAQRFTAAGGTGVVLRFAMFYGPDSSHTQDMINFVRRGQAPTFGSRDGFMSSVSTDDAATAVLASLTAPAGTWNVGDDLPLRREEYFHSLARALDRTDPWIPPEWLKHAFGSVAATVARSHRVSNRRFRDATGWAPRQASIADGWPTVLRQMGIMDGRDAAPPSP